MFKSKSKAIIPSIPAGRLLPLDVIAVGGQDYAVRSIQNIYFSPNLLVTLTLLSADTSSAIPAPVIEMVIPQTTTLEVRNQ